MVSAPLVIAGLGFAPWLLGCLVFPAITMRDFGRWSPELASQQVLSPLINGFLAATTSYLLLDWLFRVRIVPAVFPTGRVTASPHAVALGVSARLFVFLIAVAFTPLFTMLGLVRATAVRVARGGAPATVVGRAHARQRLHLLVYVALGVGLTLLLGRTLTRPLAAVAAALRRVQAGDLTARVAVEASDEVGVLQSGVNEMVLALREKERIRRPSAASSSRRSATSFCRGTCVWAASCARPRSYSAICAASPRWRSTSRRPRSSPRSTSSSAS